MRPKLFVNPQQSLITPDADDFDQISFSQVNDSKGRMDQFADVFDIEFGYDAARIGMNGQNLNF